MKIRQKSEQMARNEHELNYDENRTFVIDCRDFVPIYAGDSSVESPYCGSMYADASMENKPCETCGVSTVGVKTLGLVTR